MWEGLTRQSFMFINYNSTRFVLVFSYKHFHVYITKSFPLLNTKYWRRLSDSNCVT